MLKLYNTLTGKKEIFKPIKGKKVNLYVCGVTPYDFTHLGHARTYLVFDMIAKYLRQTGYNVFYLQNITDIDDKILKKAEEKGVSWISLSRKFEKEYLKDMKILKADSVTEYARATDNIKEIIKQIKQLLKKGYAYQIKDGIYYDIAKFKDYGKLSGRTATGAEDAVSRIDQAKEKRNKGDFCLWKFSKRGEPMWDFKTGKYLGIEGRPGGRNLTNSYLRQQVKFSLPGRPGWHIEDTAIAEKFFGPKYDIHGGGRDLIFPHHEAEIAQMEAVSAKKPMAKYWLHTGFLTVKGKKMSKSLGNFITLKDFLKTGSLRLLRFLVLKNHYRSPLDYKEKSILQAEKELARIDEFLAKPEKAYKSQDRNFSKEFNSAMEDDFNAPKAIAAIFKLIRSGKLSKEDLKLLKEADGFFQFIFQKKEKTPKNVSDLVSLRQKYRKEKNWQKADNFRKKIEELGWQIEDTETGPKLKKIR